MGRWSSGTCSALLLAAAALSLAGCTVNLGTPPVLLPTATVTVEVTAEAESDQVIPVSPPPVAESPTALDPSPQPELTTNSDPLASIPPEQVHLFESPSGNLRCVIDIGMEGIPRAGCASWDSVANMPECDERLMVPMIEFFKGGRPVTDCAWEGPYGTDLIDEVLEYGQEVSAYGITCASESTGMTCRDDSTGYGFTAARAGFRPIG